MEEKKIMAQLENEEMLVHPELPRVTCEELKQFMDEGVNLLLVDARGESHFKKEHIKGAINIPNDPLPPLTEQMITIRLTMLPWDKMIIFYCD